MEGRGGREEGNGGEERGEKGNGGRKSRKTKEMRGRIGKKQAWGVS